MKFELIRKMVIEQENKRMPTIENEEQLNKKLISYGKSYKGTYEEQKKKFYRFIIKKIEKSKAEELKFIEEVENAEDFNGLTLTIEWKKSAMWGSNPKTYTNYGFESRSIGGCGYNKHSTATAEGLNSHKPLLKRLFIAEERRLKENKAERRSYIGYGSGYFAKPYFEGGVGVSSHESIINGLGLKWVNVTNTKNIDVHRIE